jgi:hypothetical protein
LAVPQMTPQIWHIAMPAEEPSTASEAVRTAHAICASLGVGPLC